jgi:large repetitive protein
MNISSRKFRRSTELTTNASRLSRIRPIETSAGRVRSRVSALVVVGVVGALFASAVRASGDSAKQTQFNDSAVWELDRSAGRLRHWSMKVQLSGSFATTGANKKQTYVEQGGAGIVLIDRDAQTLQVLDDKNLALQQGGAKVTPETLVKVGRNSIYVIDPVAGLVRKTTANTLSNLDKIDSVPAMIDAGGPIRAELGVDDTIHVLNLKTGGLESWNDNGKRVKSVTLKKISAKAQMTAIGGSPLVLDEASETLHIAGNTVKEMTLKGKGRIMALPTAFEKSPAVFANELGDIETLDISEKAALPQMAVPGIGPNPVRPVIEPDGCIVGASSGSGRVGGICPNDENANALVEAFTPGHELKLLLVNGDYFVDDLQSNRSSQRGIDGMKFEVTNDAPEEGQTPEGDTDDLQGKTTSSANAEVAPINKRPKAVADELFARPDRTTVLPVLLNDLDPNGDDLSVVAVTGVPTNVTAEPAFGGQGVVFRPQAGFLGKVSFRVTISDPDGETDTSPVTVTVDDQANNAPLAIDDSAKASVGRLTLLDVLANDQDPDGDTMSVISASVVSGAGDVVVGSSGVLSFTPTQASATVLDYVVQDELGERANAKVQVEVSDSSNLPPIARNDVFEVTLGTTVLDLLANDMDPDGSLLTITETPTSVAPLGNLQREGNLVRINANQQGSQTFVYRISDGTASATARVRVVVKPSVGNHPPLAIPDRLSITPGSKAAIDVVRNDTDSDGDVLGVVSWTAQAGVTLSSTDNRRLLVELDQAVSAPQVVLYEVSDGTATVTGTLLVTPLPVVGDLSPVARDDQVGVRIGAERTIRVLTNDADPESGPLKIVGLEGAPAGVTVSADSRNVNVAVGAFPANGSFRYTITDIGGNQASATVNVEAVTDPNENRVPLARADKATVRSGNAVVIPVTANDDDPDGDSIRLKDQGSPSKGTATMVGGSIRYVANAGAVGTDRFQYTLTDGRLDTIAEVSVGILPTPRSNQPPSAVDDGPIEVKTGATLNVDVLTNDSDPDKDTLRVTNVAEPSEGSVVLNGSTVAFTAGTTAGEVRLRYTIADAAGATARAFVVFRVVQGGSGQPPIANADTSPELASKTSAVVAVLDNDEDPDGDPRSLVVVDVKGIGAEIASDKRGVKVTAGATSSSVTYTIRDAQGNTASGTIAVVVGSGASLVAVDDSAATGASKTVEIDVLANDQTKEGLKPLSIVRVGKSADGTVSLLGRTKLSFRPKDGFSGNASFTYTVTDTSGATKTGNVKVVVSAGAKVNRPPVVKAGGPIALVAGGSQPVDLASLTKDPDGDVLRFEVGEVPAQVTATLVGSVLSISAPISASPWSGSIRFKATDPSDASNENAVFVTIAATSTTGVSTTTIVSPPGVSTTKAPAGPTTVVRSETTSVNGTAPTVAPTSTTNPPIGPTVPGTPTAAPQPPAAPQVTVAPTPVPSSSPNPRAPEPPVITPVPSPQAPQPRAQQPPPANPPAPQLPAPQPPAPQPPIATPNPVPQPPVAKPPAQPPVVITPQPQPQPPAPQPPIPPAPQPPAPKPQPPVVPDSEPPATIVAPGVPTGLRVVGATASSIELAWIAPANNGGSPIVRYELSLDGGEGNRGPATSQNWTGLPPGTTHSFRVRACNATKCSGYSASVSGRTLDASRPPAPVTGVTAGSITDTSVTISFQPSAVGDGNGNPTSYEVQVVGGAKQTGPQLSQTMTGLTPGVSYQFVVSACNSLGCTAAPAVSALTREVDPPTGVTVGNATASSLTISWNAGGSSVTKYEVSLDGGSGNGNAATSQTWPGLLPDTPHSFRVRACTASGCSAYSESVTGRTLKAARVPAAVTGVVSDAITDSSVTIKFQPSAVGDGNGSPTSYEVQVVDGAKKTGPQLSQSMTSLSPGTTYQFIVSACNAMGCTPAPAISAKTTGTPPVTAVVPDPPVAPALAFTTREIDSIKIDQERGQLSWVPPADGGSPITKYRLATNGAVSDVAGLSSAVPIASISSMGGQFTYAVSACNAVGCSAPSSSAKGPVLMNTSLVVQGPVPANAIGFVYAVSVNCPSGSFVATRSGAVDIFFVSSGLTCTASTTTKDGRAISKQITSPGGPLIVTYPAAPGAMSAPIISAPTTSSLVLGISAPSELGSPAMIVRYEGSLNGGATVRNIGNPPSYIWNELAPATPYSFVVRACNGATTCGPWSPAGTGTTTAAVGPPGQMAAPSIQRTEFSSITIGYATPTDQGNPATIIRYEGMMNSGGARDIGGSGAYPWSGLASGTTYTFQVRACNATGCGPWSGGTQATTPTPPPPPPQITFSFIENPFRCDGVSRGFGSVTGFVAGETVRFTWNNNGKDTLLPGVANAAGTVNLIWQCTNADWEGPIALTAVGQSSGRSGTGNFSEARV